MSYNDLSAAERVSAVHIDLMQDPEFSRLGPTTQIGQTYIALANICPTAKTNGLDRWYNEAWVMRMKREQLRAVVAHECLHMMLMHCTAYNKVFKQHKQESAMAVDYVVNLIVKDLDKGRGFIEWPTDYPPLLDEKYRDWSCLEVIADLLKNPPPPQPPMDEHEQREPSDEEAKEVEQMIDDARIQGEITSARIRSEGAGGASLKGFERTSTCLLYTSPSPRDS